MSSKSAPTALGPALVIGGCGFVGFHNVDALLKDPTCGPVSVINDPTVEPGDHLKISVEGTKNVLICATESPTVKELVYTSTCAVSKGYQHFNIDETTPLWEENSKTIAYFKAKVLADTLIHEANSLLDRQGRCLPTATLRLALVYEERDNQFITGMLKTAGEGQTKIQLAANEGLAKPTHVGKIATAHLLAAKKLLESESGSLDPKVDGEAFHITDGDPQPL
ncbi:hypothetical protein OEA41_006412 [Lepraria neglecta]|uniref:3-beta hydroxysteroid dehydrogenase/isomerase domain-containing protein n=1 Tax=Lepraria neglecta TaxID=209136 RepID=A0AAE0DN11_9LECA|nr:hypothetical protein OEA41_006412 [Lepraria neglecta]